MKIMMKTIRLVLILIAILIHGSATRAQSILKPEFRGVFVSSTISTRVDRFERVPVRNFQVYVPLSIGRKFTLSVGYVQTFNFRQPGSFRIGLSRCVLFCK